METQPSPELDSPGAPNAATAEAAPAKPTPQLPRYAGVLLMSVGMAGVVLPGAIGTPFVILGGMIVCPSLFRKPDRWLQRRFPSTRRRAMQFMERFQADLDGRYPNSNPRDPSST